MLSFFNRIMRDFNFHPYKLQAVPKLHENNHHLRLTFFHDEIKRIADDPQHLMNVLHTDEANFHLSGAVSMQDFRYWTSEYPSWVSEDPLYSIKVVVWGGVGMNRIIGPYFFKETINSQRYLGMLQHHIWPQLNAG
jgi:hypothetical protein